VRGTPRKLEKASIALATIAGCLTTVPCFAADEDSFFGRDKALHFSASAMIAGDGYAAASLVSKGERARAIAGAGAATAAGIVKEVYDGWSGGDASLRDLTWDVLGATTGATVAWLIDRYLF
jgi:putative lipoprotein